MAKIPAAHRLNELELRLMRQYELALGSHAQGDLERPKKFMARLIREVPEILLKAEGHIEIAGLVFGIDPGLIEDLKRDNHEIIEAQIQGIGIRNAREAQSRDAAGRLKEEQLRKLKEEDPNPIRTDPLPQGIDARYLIIKDLCPRYLRAYSGSCDQMAGPMSVMSDEIQDVIDSDPVLIELQSVCQASPLGAALRNLEQQAATGGHSAVVKFLEKVHPEKYGPKQEVKFKGGGFEVPPSDFGTKNVLFPVKTEESE